jgi:hypothetical protein
MMAAEEQEYRDYEEQSAETEEEQLEVAASEEEDLEEGSSEQEEEEGKKPKRKSAQQRIRELTAKYRQTERELQELRRLLNDRGERQEDYQQLAQMPQRPKREDYDNEDDYFEALADYKAEQRLAEQQKKQEQKTEQQRQQEEQQRITKAVNQINESGMQEFEDYEDVVLDNNSLQITDNMVRTIADMDYGHRVAYHLGKNPDKAAKLAEMSPSKQAAELGKLESQLTQSPGKKSKSKAPAPPSSVKGSGESSESDEPSDKDDIETWMRKRARQARQRGKR